MQNPFDNLDNRLITIEKVLVKLDDKLIHAPSIGTEEKPDRYITTEEVAKIYGVSKVTINDWDNKGIIIGYRLGNTKRYKLSEIMTAPKLIIRKKK
jgi:excisionase family DNA binding protein